MEKILHTSDLHIQSTQDKENYSLHAWKSILNLAIQESISCILLAGDVFNSYQDLELTRKEFLDCIRLTGFKGKIYAIPGNHEYIKIPTPNSLSTFDLRPVEWILGEPFTVFHPSDSWELVAIPYKINYGNYIEWNIPSKLKTRIVMAHGLIPEAKVYTGPSEEEGDHIIEWDLIRQMDPDYVALGHIHKKTNLSNLNIQGGYPGSPLVWRAGEEGPRMVEIITIHKNNKIDVQSLELKDVGQYRKVTISVSSDSEISKKANETFSNANYSPMDFIDLEFMGVTEKETEFNNIINEFKKNWEKKFRKIEINNEKMIFMDGILSNSLVQTFLEKIENKLQEATLNNDYEQIAILQEAKLIGLKTIKNMNQ